MTTTQKQQRARDVARITKDNEALRIQRERSERMERHIANCADLAATDWFRQACRNPYAKFALYWRKAREGEKASLPIVGTEAPSVSQSLRHRNRQTDCGHH